MPEEEINIQPNVSILSVFRHLNLTHWSALSEYIVNSLDSFLQNQEELKVLGTEKCIVDIEFNIQEQSIVIKDNAAGISSDRVHAAFRVPYPPPGQIENSAGNSMLVVSCWYSDNWTVRSKSIGEDIERKVNFDIPRITEENNFNLNIKTQECSKEVHYTIFELNNVRQIPRGNTLRKVKEFLSRQYRNFINSGTLEIRLDGEVLKFIEPEILKAPRWDNPNGEVILWKEEFDFKVQDYLHPNIETENYMGDINIRGFVALQEKMSNSYNVIDIFRRGRLLNEKPLRPLNLFGPQYSTRYKRLFGEIHIDNLRVGFTREPFQLDRLAIFRTLEAFLRDKDILKQADKFRRRVQTNYIVDEILRHQRSISRLNDKLRDTLPDFERENLLSDLFDYCQSNDNLVPAPIKWAGLFDILRTSPKFSSNTPHNPCILGGYWADYLTKRKRFLGHIYWAFEHNLLEEINRFIRNLNYDDWNYCREYDKDKLKKFTVEEIKNLDTDLL